MRNGYQPNYSQYSRAPQGWHDEPFEYVFSFAQFLPNVTIVAAQQFDFLNNPLQFDPDADFYMRGIAVLVDETEGGPDVTLVSPLFNMRLRDSFGRPLDNQFIPMMAYATSPGDLGLFPGVPGSPVATPWYPELYCPANSAMWADFQCQPVSIVATPNLVAYAFHLYFQGIKRFQNEDCVPGSTSTSSAKKSSVWFEGTAA